MSIDSILRALGALTCVYAFGLFVSLMSTAALNAAARDSSGPCSDRTCVHLAAASQHHAAPGPTPPREAPAIHLAALFIAGGY